MSDDVKKVREPKKIRDRRRKLDYKKKNEKRHLINLRRIKAYKAIVKNFKEEKDVSKAEKLLNEVKKKLDKIGAKKIYHKNKVNRLKSRFDKMQNELKKNAVHGV